MQTLLLLAPMVSALVQAKPEPANKKSSRAMDAECHAFGAGTGSLLSTVQQFSSSQH
jgi:hypothetical protein